MKQHKKAKILFFINLKKSKNLLPEREHTDRKLQTFLGKKKNDNENLMYQNLLDTDKKLSEDIL